MASPQNLIVKLILSAKDEASGIFDSFKAKAAGVAAAVAAYFSVDFLAGSVKSAADFEAAMSRVQAATGAAGDELGKLKQAAEDAGANTKYTSVEAASALEGLAKAGLSAAQAVTALPAVLALAEAGDVSLAESASYVTRTVSGMGVAVEEAGRIADVLAMGANASNTSVRGLAEALSYAGPTARSLGLSLEQTVAYIGKFADAGIDASRAGTALNAILAQFQDPASKFRAALVDAGITTSNFDVALRQLAVSGQSGEKAILAVGTEAGPALRGLLNQGIGALDELKAKLDNAKGSAEATAATMGSNLNGSLQGLSSAWDALKTKLGEPVLPTVTQAVKDLTAGLQGAISNGTVTAFGEALRSAFASAAEWARKFASEIDPATLAAKLQETAGKVGAWFDAVAEGARNAGDIVRTAYGVMSGGVNVVAATVYKIAEAFAGVSRDILASVATIAEGLAKVTFGGLSESFKAAAAEIRLSAGGMGAVSEEYGRQAAKAFDNAATGAELARKGWAGLTAPTEQAAASVKKVGEAAQATADDLDAAGDGATVAGGKIAALGAAGAAAAPGIKAVGDAARGAAAETDGAAAAADRLKAAYAAMGLQTADELRKVAAAVKGHYEAIKADGTATPAILEAAFRKYADAAIAANGGVASETLKAEAAMRGLIIQSDGARTSIEKIGTAGQDAGRGVVSGMANASDAVARVRSDADKLADRLASLKSPNLGAGGYGNQSTGNGSFEDLRRAGMTPEQMKNAGYSSREIEDYIVGNDKVAPGFVNRQVTSSSVNTYQAAIDAGLTDAEAKKVGDIYGYYVAKGNKEAQQRAGGTLGLGFNGADYAAVTRDMLNQAMAEAKRLVAAEAKAANKGAGGGSGSPQFWGAPNRAVTVHINLGGKTTSINAASQADADALVRALQAAAAAQS